MGEGKQMSKDEIDMIRDLRKSVARVGDDCKRNKELAKEYFEKTDQNNLLQKGFFITHEQMYEHFEITYTLCEGLMGSLLRMLETIQRFPNRDEFNEIKEKIEADRKKVIETLLPIKEAIDQTHKNNKEIG